ncbi:carboxypeptidase-like regulatory domain-containing protein [Flavobacterium johnsoniae]|uniref:carboxypeptidase-like regulatory domain-containing protein n=1 Tax=Flavobacterium johnsoniae TaxID=986 RepID=UPI0025B22865|nr:carboxypeptidase-like regulatory domain-containing protein [Flavobacterium johnsoniae]WJS96807.1 carboxypeptidase-like regulatory domain-containing protein [Flavobacterium johnsoniae]
MIRHLTLLCLVSFHTFFGQKLLATGFVSDNDDDIKKYLARGTAIIHKEKQNSLPVSLDRYIPRILDQGNQGACTAFAVAEALSMRENFLKKNINNGAFSSNQILYSPAYLWVVGNEGRKITDNCVDVGISYSRVFSCLFKNKIVHWGNFPYPNDIDEKFCFKLCPPNVKLLRIQDREFIYDELFVNVESIKNKLLQGYPVCISVNLDTEYYKALYDTGVNRGLWLKKGTPLLKKQQHSMVIVDYNQSKRLFKVLNSYGPGLGDKGFIWLSYDLIDKDVVFNAYIMSFDKLATSGPLANIERIFKNDFFSIELNAYENSIEGRVVDNEGKTLPGVTISVVGSPKGTTTDMDGKFRLIGDNVEKLNISYIGSTSEQISISKRSKQVYETGITATWTKEDEFRVYNGIRFGVASVDLKSNSIQISVVDEKTGIPLTNNVFLLLNDKIELHLNDKIFYLMLKDLKVLDDQNSIALNAANIEYSLISNIEVLTEYY